MAAQHPMMPFAEARQRLLAALTPCTEGESVPLPDALGRVLQAPVEAPVSLPPAANSAMDGYALAAGDAPAGAEYDIRGEALAGAPWNGALRPGEALRIMTGAVVPPGADRVIMQEQTEQSADQRLRLNTECPPGNNIRPAGDDVTAGTEVLPAGRRLQVTDLALLGALGLSKVTVVRRLRVALLATGDELRQAGETLAPGDIYESNRLAISLLLRPLPVEITDLGIVRDDPTALRQCMAGAMRTHDLVVSTGGVSVGAADYTRDILQELGDIDFWKVAIKPGKPVAFGRLGKGWFFGLPGNPVSALVTAHQLLVPALGKLSGAAVTAPLTLTVPAAEPLRKKPGRLDFQRAVLSQTVSADGRCEHSVRPASGQGSHMLWSLAQANAYAVLPAESGDIQPGDPVTVVPFDPALGWFTPTSPATAAE
ncbi:molybdopterin molybdotransferase MoeA [Natronospirillum operosum]|uniref:Molybdopterin molybdenumtransferase n=1 Tax=Natronospirillum operosum TaxID=2759953 RepID=A0A4Z0WEQ7_9GAMM|nr:gephyrin-like molybdotransferase Glp [Natronospirillum operosum]TGG92778.1 molybdopterin molybdotransferase MoeA [Natronospirillum operosum]